MEEPMHNGSPPPPPSTPPPIPETTVVYSSSPSSSLRSPRSPRRPQLYMVTPSPRPSSPGRIKALIAEDPLLAHLTPSTLSRMSTDDAMQFSPGEREVGVWAATARQKIEDWVVEVDSWENQCGWVKMGGEGFMVPAEDDKGRKRRKLELRDKIRTAKSGPPSPPVSRRLFDNVPPMPQPQPPKTPTTPTKPQRIKKANHKAEGSDPKPISAANTIDDLLSPTSTPLPMTKRLDLSLGRLPGDSPDSGGKDGGPRRRSIQIGSLASMHGTPTPTPSKRTTWDFSSLGSRSITSPVSGFQPASPVAEVFDDYDEEEDDDDDGEGDGGTNGVGGHEGTFYGSITGAVVDHYAARIESITSSLQRLDIEALKSRVLAYRTNSSGHELTDSEAVITATTLQLLPPLNKLSFLLEAWSNRLEVCRVVPTLLSSFDDAEYVIFSKGNDWLADYDEPGKEYSESSAQELDDAFEKMKEAVEKRVLIAGRIVDGMLDMLDGKEETIPDDWIDRIEKLEEGLADWVLDQETRVWELKRTWRERKEHRLLEERLERERIERERLEKERLERKRLEQERLERERLERLEQERIERERLEQERFEQERLEQERLEQERLEQERLEQERLEQERSERERLERERLEQERLERERIEQESLEQERPEQERLEQERLEQERLEEERLERERLEQERLEQERIEQERIEKERVERERLEAEEAAAAAAVAAAAVAVAAAAAAAAEKEFHPAEIALPDTREVDGNSDAGDMVPRITIEDEENSLVEDVPHEHLPETAYSDTHIDELEHRHIDDVVDMEEDSILEDMSPVEVRHFLAEPAVAMHVPDTSASDGEEEPLEAEEPLPVTAEEVEGQEDHTKETLNGSAIEPAEEISGFEPASEDAAATVEDEPTYLGVFTPPAEEIIDADTKLPELGEFPEAPVEEEFLAEEVPVPASSDLAADDEPSIMEDFEEDSLAQEAAVPLPVPTDDEPVVEEEEELPTEEMSTPLPVDIIPVPEPVEAEEEQRMVEDEPIPLPVNVAVEDEPIVEEEIRKTPVEEESIPLPEDPVDQEELVSREVEEQKEEEDIQIEGAPDILPIEVADDLPSSKDDDEDEGIINPALVSPKVVAAEPTEDDDIVEEPSYVPTPEMVPEAIAVAAVPVEEEQIDRGGDLAAFDFQTPITPPIDFASVEAANTDGSAVSYVEDQVEGIKEVLTPTIPPMDIPLRDVDNESLKAADEESLLKRDPLQLSTTTPDIIESPSVVDEPSPLMTRSSNLPLPIVTDTPEAFAVPTGVTTPELSISPSPAEEEEGDASPLLDKSSNLPLGSAVNTPVAKSSDNPWLENVNTPVAETVSTPLAGVLAAPFTTPIAHDTSDVFDTPDVDDSDNVSVTSYNHRLSIGSYLPSPLATRSTFTDDKPDLLSTSFLTPHESAFPGKSGDDEDDAGSSVSPVSPVSSEFEDKPTVKPAVVRQSSRPVSPIVDDDEMNLPVTPGLQFPFEDGEYFNRVGDARKPKVLDTRQELSPSPDFLSQPITRALGKRPAVSKSQPQSRIPSSSSTSAAAEAVIAKYSGIPKRSLSSSTAIPRYTSSRDEGLSRSSTTRTHTRNTQSQDDISRFGATRKTAVSHMKTSSIPRLSTVVSKEELKPQKSTMEKLPLKTMMTPEAEDDDDDLLDFNPTFSPGGTLRRRKGNVGERRSLSGDQYRPPSAIVDSPTTPVRRRSVSQEQQSGDWVVSPGSPTRTYPSSPDLDAHEVHTLKRKPKMLGKPKVILPDTTPTTSPTSTISPVLSSPGKLAVSKFNITPPKAEKKPEVSLDQKINSILTTLPASAKVKLTPSPMKIKPAVQKRDVPIGTGAGIGSSSKPTKSTGLRSSIPAPKGLSSAADDKGEESSASASSRRQHIGGDIKMYHLHRPNGESPVKLFVRLVGEGGERVMVRVGGGWADLGAYLREYASHHGSQHMNAAEAKIEVGDIIPGRSLRTSGSNGSLRSISSLGYRRSPTPGGSRPTSPLPPTAGGAGAGIRATPPSGRLGGGSESPVYLTSTSLAASRRREGRESPSFNNARASPLLRGRVASPTTPTLPSPPGNITPGSGGRPSSRTSLNVTPGAYSNYRLPSSRLSYGAESPSSRLEPGDVSVSPASPPTPLGMAGPKSRKREMSAEKQAWVDRLEGQVRKVSAERSARFLQHAGSSNASLRSDLEGTLDGSDGAVSTDGMPSSRRTSRNAGEFREFGKVGGTRRVLMTSTRPNYGALQSQRIRREDAGSRGSLRREEAGSRGSVR